MIILDGKKIKNKILDELHEEVTTLPDKLTLAVIQVGNNEASNIYIRQKEKMAAYIGYDFKLLKFPEDIKEIELINEIEKLNNDANINGIMVQLPLPKNMNVKLILNTIDERKDVDGYLPLAVANYFMLKTR